METPESHDITKKKKKCMYVFFLETGHMFFFSIRFSKDSKTKKDRRPKELVHLLVP